VDETAYWSDGCISLATLKIPRARERSPRSLARNASCQVSENPSGVSARRDFECTGIQRSIPVFVIIYRHSENRTESGARAIMRETK